MLTCQIDTQSPYHVEIPPAQEKVTVYSRSEAFVTYDLTLPPEEQSPYTPDLIDLINQCDPYLEDFQSNEALRTAAAEALKPLDVALKTMLDNLSLIVRASLFKTPGRAEEWGFQIKQSTGNVNYPMARQKRLAVLKTYIKKEQSRPVEERITEPSLDSVIQLYNDIKAKVAERDAGRRGRKQSQAASMELSKQMVDCLRSAGVLLVSRRFKYKITHDLENWGYEVVKRSGRTAKSETDAVDAADSTNGADTTPTNGSFNLNGASEMVLNVNGESQL